MRNALLLIDLQEDYLTRPDLVPERHRLIGRVSVLLEGCRTAGVPVFHVMTLIPADGSRRMPHWRRAGKLACVEGTPGAQPPALIAPRTAEAILSKTFFSAFDSPSLSEQLALRGVEQVLLAGVYTHACIRATALDAYARGFEVVVARDGVASYDPIHAEITIDYLEGRAARFLGVEEILWGLRRRSPRGRSSKSHGGAWIHRNAVRWDEILGEVPLQGVEEVATAAVRAATFARSGARGSSAQRWRQLVAWRALLKRHHEDLAQQITRDIAKPIAEARAEMNYALDLLQHTIETCQSQRATVTPAGTEVAWPPAGVVALITPFNNPVAIPVGKLAPALAYGNSVLWKPALEGTAVGRRMVELLVACGFGAAVQCVSGGAETAQALIARPEVGAVSFTGSIASGRLIAAACTRHGTRLQAELGGNNAVLVMEDVDPDDVARTLAAALFSFSGQRCTAPRRIIVHRKSRAHLIRSLQQQIALLRLGEPKDPDTQVGPVVSRQAQARMADLVADGLAAGGRLICGGAPPPQLSRGCWFEPTVIADPAADAQVVRTESFGPVAVLLEASDFDSALEQCNAVSHGLVATLYTNRRVHQRRFCAQAEAGILSLNGTPLPIDPDAPFGGWKSSGLGGPEHGSWDRDFYTRPQAIYRRT